MFLTENIVSEKKFFCVWVLQKVLLVLFHKHNLTNIGKKGCECSAQFAPHKLLSYHKFQKGGAASCDIFFSMPLIVSKKKTDAKN